MQLTEDLDRGLIHLHAVGDTLVDKKFLEKVSKKVRTHGLIEFQKTESILYIGNHRSRKAAHFKVPGENESIILMATGKADEKVLDKILIALSTTSTRNRYHRPVGVYLYSYGNIRDDKRHHLNGPYVSVCLAFCRYCHKTPLVDRIQLAEKMCGHCKVRYIEDLGFVKKPERSTKPKVLKSVWKWVLNQLLILIQSVGS